MSQRMFKQIFFVLWSFLIGSWYKNYTANISTVKNTAFSCVLTDLIPNVHSIFSWLSANATSAAKVQFTEIYSGLTVLLLYFDCVYLQFRWPCKFRAAFWCILNLHFKRTQHADSCVSECNSPMVCETEVGFIYNCSILFSSTSSILE